MSRKNALKPLRQRLNPEQKERRQFHITARRSIAEGLIANQNQLANLSVGFIYQGFWARLKWLVFGPPKIQQPQQKEAA